MFGIFSLLPSNKLFIDQIARAVPSNTKPSFFCAGTLQVRYVLQNLWLSNSRYGPCIRLISSNSYFLLFSFIFFKWWQINQSNYKSAVTGSSYKTSYPFTWRKQRIITIVMKCAINAKVNTISAIFMKCWQLSMYLNVKQQPFPYDGQECNKPVS